MNVNKIIQSLRNADREFNREQETVPLEHHVNQRELENSNYKIINIYNPLKFEEKNFPESLDEIFPLDTMWISEKSKDSFADTDVDSINGKIREHGIDHLAWYRSFHYKPTEKWEWGIYITDYGLYYLASHVFRNLKSKHSLSVRDLISLSAKLLFNHEFFHYITDIASTVIEAQSSFMDLYYQEYTNQVYLNPKTSDEPLEEALANAFAYKKRYLQGAKELIRNFMDNQPKGYRAYGKFLSNNDFANGRRQLAKSILTAQTSYNSHLPLEILFDYQLREIKQTDVPIYLVSSLIDSPFSIMSFSNIPRNLVDKTDKFERDLEKLSRSIPKINSILEDKLNELQYNAFSHGLGFKPLRGTNSHYEFRINRKNRVTMRIVDSGRFELLEIGGHA